MQGGFFTYGLLAALAIALLIAAFTDLRRRQIDNWLNAAIALAAPLFWLASGLDLVDIGFQLGIAAGDLLSCSRRCSRCGAMGGGDVKLLTALALWIEPVGFVKLLVLMAMLGGLLTLVCWLHPSCAASARAASRFLMASPSRSPGCGCWPANIFPTASAGDFVGVNLILTILPDFSSLNPGYSRGGLPSHGQEEADAADGRAGHCDRHRACRTEPVCRRIRAAGEGGRASAARAPRCWSPSARCRSARSSRPIRSPSSTGPRKWSRTPTSSTARPT